MPPRRSLMYSRFGTYLKNLRIEKGMSGEKLASLIGLSSKTIYIYEQGKSSHPSEDTVKLWLKAVGQIKRIPEAIRFLRCCKDSRTIHYGPDPMVNEHLDRIIDALENETLDLMDRELLSLIAIKQYRYGDTPDPLDYTNQALLETRDRKVVKQDRSPSKGKSTGQNTAAAQLGRAGGKIGGPARAKKLSSTERSQIAKKGGEAKAKNKKG